MPVFLPSVKTEKEESSIIIALKELFNIEEYRSQ
jgi:hypothetical protein